MAAPATPPITLAPASPSDFDALAALRQEAMRESLARLGLFDPARSTARLRAGFVPDRTRLIRVAGELAGFVIAGVEGDAWRIAHLYVRPAFQSKGLGSAVLAGIVAEARSRGQPVLVTALRDSRANDFYASHGFARVDAEGFDVHYRLETAP